MNCPYCVEEIKDQAIVCHHCGRDLRFFKPIHEQVQQLSAQVSTLEQTVSQMSEVLDSLRFRSQTSAIVPITQKNERPSLIHFALLTIAQVLTSAVLMTTGVLILNAVTALIHQQYLSPEYLPRPSYPDQRLERFKTLPQAASLAFGLIFTPLLLLSPLPFGLWLGVKWRGSHLRYYLGLGVIAGVLEAPVMLTLSAFVLPLDTTAMVMLSLVNVARTTLVFTTGALGGDVIERVRFGSSSTETGFAEKVAKRLISSRKPADSDNSYARRLKLAADFVSALAPILTFIAALLTAYIGYLATIASGKK